MLQPTALVSIRSLLSSSSSSSTVRLISLQSHRPIPQSKTHNHHLPHTPPLNTRHASHAAQGRANKAAPGPGKRLGAKKGDSELVVPGNIIFRQRGTHWFPGENCGMGRDHTIFALQKGFVRYYRDPDRHPERKFIGIVFEQDQRLPRGRNSARRRKLGLVVRPMSISASTSARTSVITDEDAEVQEQSGNVLGEIAGVKGLGEVGAPSTDVAVTNTYRASPPSSSTLNSSEDPTLTPRRPRYQYRMSNYEIGRAAENAGVKVRPHKPNDRFLAWRKRTARRARMAEKRSLRIKVKGEKKAKKRK